MNKKTYTAPAVIACTDAVQNTKEVGPQGGDEGGQEDLTPGSVGFSL